VSKPFTNIYIYRLHMGLYKPTEMATCTLYKKNHVTPHRARHCHGSWSVFPRRQLTASYSMAKDRYGEQWGTVRCNVWPTFHSCWTSPLTCYTLQLYKPLHHGSPIEATSQLPNSALICIMQNPQNVFGRQVTSVRPNVPPVTRCEALYGHGTGRTRTAGRNQIIPPQ
jgi:hypothetical protein